MSRATEYRYRALALIIVAVLLVVCIISGTVLLLQDHDASAVGQAGAALLGAFVALVAVALFGTKVDKEGD